MEKNKIIREYLLQKAIDLLDESQTWQENLAESVEVLKEEPRQHMNLTHMNMRKLAHQLRFVIDIISEIQELDEKKDVSGSVFL